jgi:hypothetical protein
VWPCTEISNLHEARFSQKINVHHDWGIPDTTAAAEYRLTIEKNKKNNTEINLLNIFFLYRSVYTYLYTNAQDLQTVEPRYSKPRNGHNTTPLTNDRMIFLLCESFRRDRASSTFRSRVENGKQMEIVDTPKKKFRFTW